MIKQLLKKIFSNEEAINLNLADAKKYEDEQDYEGACFSYACAYGQGARGKEYKRKIKYLYQEHGPFTFERQLSKLKKEYCDCCESCGEGYHSIVIKDIQKILNTK